MVREKTINIAGKSILGVEIDLPGANLVMVIGAKGYIMCGYLNLETAEKLNQAACIVRGVKSIEDLLKANVAAVSSSAKALGIKEGQVAQEALEKLA